MDHSAQLPAPWRSSLRPVISVADAAALLAVLITIIVAVNIAAWIGQVGEDQDATARERRYSTVHMAMVATGALSLGVGVGVTATLLPPVQSGLAVGQWVSLLVSLLVAGAAADTSGGLQRRWSLEASQAENRRADAERRRRARLAWGGESWSARRFAGAAIASAGLWCGATAVVLTAASWHGTPSVWWSAARVAFLMSMMSMAPLLFAAAIGAGLALSGSSVWLVLAGLPFVAWLLAVVTPPAQPAIVVPTIASYVVAVHGLIRRDRGPVPALVIAFATGIEPLLRWEDAHAPGRDTLEIMTGRPAPARANRSAGAVSGVTEASRGA